MVLMSCPKVDTGSCPQNPGVESKSITIENRIGNGTGVFLESSFIIRALKGSNKN